MLASKVTKRQRIYIQRTATMESIENLERGCLVLEEYECQHNTYTQEGICSGVENAMNVDLKDLNLRNRIRQFCTIVESLLINCIYLQQPSQFPFANSVWLQTRYVVQECMPARYTRPNNTHSYSSMRPFRLPKLHQDYCLRIASSDPLRAMNTHLDLR